MGRSVTTEVLGKVWVESGRPRRECTLTAVLPSEQSHLRVLGYEGCLAAAVPFRKRDTDIGTVMIGQS